MASKQQKLSKPVLAVAAQTAMQLEFLAVFYTVNGDTEHLELLFKSGLSVNTRFRDLPGGPTLLHLAAAKGHTQTVLLLLKQGADNSVVADAGGAPLHQAAGCGHVSTVKAMLKAGCPVDVVGSNGGSVLHAAAEGGNAEVIRAVVSAGCDINAVDNDGETPLHWAAEKGKTEAALELIRHGANRAIVAGTGGIPLHQAAGYSHVSTVKAMLKAGCPVDVVTSNGASVLHAAAEGGNAEVIRAVVSAGCDINAVYNDGVTPLHVAAESGKTEAALELIRHGANRAIVAGTGGIPLHQAAGYGHVSTVKAMLKAGCPVDVVTSNGASVLHAAAEGGNAEVIRAVVSAGCDINAVYNDGVTPLHVAAGTGNAEAALELIRHGANRAVVAGISGTPLHQAAGCGHVLTVKAMLKAGCPVEVVASSGGSVLHAAAHGGNAEVIREVLSAGCDVNAADNVGMTPLHVAAEKGNTEVLKVLTRCGATEESGVNSINVQGLTPLHYAVILQNKDCVRVLLEHGANPRKAAPYIGSPYVFATINAPTLVEACDNFLVEAEEESLPQVHEALRDPSYSLYFHKLQLDRRSALENDTFGISQLEYMLLQLETVNEEVVLRFHHLSLVNSDNLLLLAAILGLNTFVYSLINITTFRPSFAAQIVTSLVRLHYPLGAMPHLQELVPPDASLNLLHVAVLGLKGKTSMKDFIEARSGNHPLFLKSFTIKTIGGDHSSFIKSLVTSDSFCHILHEHLPNGLTPLDLAEKVGLDEAVTIISSAGGRHGIYAMISEEVRLQHGPALLLAHQELMKVASSSALGQQAVQAVISQLPGRTTVEQGTATEESHICQQKVLNQRPDLAIIITAVLPKVNCRNWEEMGILLQVPTSTLEHLEHSQFQLRDRYRKVLKYWLAHNGAASWRTLLEVLSHFETQQTMDQLAHEILATQDCEVS